MVKNLTVTGGRVNLELIELEEVLQRLQVTREQLVDVAILAGTDFNNGVKGIGAKKGLKLVKEHENIFNVLKHMKIELEVDPSLLRDMFLKHDVSTDYKLKWKKPDKDGVIDFLCAEHDFSEDRVLSALEKLKKLDMDQSSLEKWF